MEEKEEALALLNQQKFREAAGVLDRMLVSGRDSDELWYLRGMVSLKLRNYDNALECFERAIALGKKSRYYQIKGLTHFEVFEISQAIDAFISALSIEPEDVTSNFFLAMCYMFNDDPRSDMCIKKAYGIDPKKTKQLLLNFYTLFFKDDPRVSLAQKENIEDRIRGMKG